MKDVIRTLAIGVVGFSMGATMGLWAVPAAVALVVYAHLVAESYGRS